MRSLPRWLFFMAAALLLVAFLASGVDVARAQEGAHGPMGADGPYGPGWETADEAVAPAGAGEADVEVGKAGTVFRYVRQYGVTEEAYPADTAHLNFPYGIATDGTNVWIAESFGRRILNFKNDGSFISSFGKPGFVYHGNSLLAWIAGIGIDGDGDVWIADGSGYVVQFTLDGDYISQLGSPYNTGTGNDQFGSPGPVGIAFDNSGNVYISDGAQWWSDSVGNHRVQIFNSSGNYVATIGQTGVATSDNGHFRGPRHIAVFGNTLYVADSGNHRVQLFNISSPATPTYTGTIGVTGQPNNDNSHLNSPSGVAVDANYIYVADTWNHRIQVFNRNSRSYVATIGGTEGEGPAQFRYPSDVAVDAAGTIFVADFVNTRVQQFNAARDFVRSYGVAGVPYVADNERINHPMGLTVDDDGNIFLVEDGGHRLLKLNRAGNQVWTVGAAGVKGDWNWDNDRLNNPGDVALDSNGRVYVADKWHSRVQIYNGDGSYHASLYGPDANDGFNCLEGLDVDSEDKLYVADTCNHRVVIFNSGLSLIGTIGEREVAGTDNSHFNEPTDVAVDQSGRIYVAERYNHRVQVYSSSREYIRTIGETGITSREFDHLNGPTRLTIDDEDHLYVADSWNNGRMQVFTTDGKYLTTIGGQWGTGTGEIRDAHGVAVDSGGNLYVSDYHNHRILKYAPNYPGWVQRNINGFGEYNNNVLTALAPFGGALYAGTYNNSGEGAQIWSMGPGGAWTKRVAAGFGDGATNIVNHLVPFKDGLYAGTRNSSSGGRIYRSGDGGHWQAVSPPGFGDADNAAVHRMEAFDGMLYAGTTVFTNTHGLEIWRSASGDPGTWQRVVEDGLGDKQDYFSWSSAEHDGHLYFGTANLDRSVSPWENGAGAVVMRSDSGDAGSWSQVNASGFGDVENFAITGLVSFDGYLYAGTARWSWNGAEIWRCQTCDSQSDWRKVMNNGFGTYRNWGPTTLHVFDGFLYVVVGNPTDGMEVWRSETGESGSWQKVAADGFGDSNNRELWYNAVATYQDNFYAGTANWANSGEVWMFLDQMTLLPGVRQ